MSYIFIGLGNPGEEYENTRHNTGREILLYIQKMIDGAGEWKYDKKLDATVSKLKIADKPVLFVMPETFMNNSGKSVKPLIVPAGVVDKKKIEKEAMKVMVIYDDLDLPFGTSKISFNKSSGGHKGVESIIKTLKTEKFARMRIGISSTTPGGKTHKPHGEEVVHKHILGKFKPDETLELKKFSKKVLNTLETFINSGLEKAMTEFN